MQGRRIDTKTQGIIVGLCLALCLTIGVIVRGANGTATGVPSAGTGSIPAGTISPQQKVGMVATRRAAVQATARLVPSPQIPPPPALAALPHSCPSPVAVQSHLVTPERGVEGVKLAQHLSTASVVAGGESYVLDSGSLLSNPHQGVILVLHYFTDPCVHQGQPPERGVYAVPGQHGAMTLTGILGSAVTFRSADGTMGQFDVVAKQFTSGQIPTVTALAPSPPMATPSASVSAATASQPSVTQTVPRRP